MPKEVISFIVGVVSMIFVEMIITRIGSRETVSDDQEGKQHYVMRMPRALKTVYKVFFWIGALSFIVFLVGHLTVGGIKNTYLALALIMACASFLAVAALEEWRVCVDGDRITVYRLFHKAQGMPLAELDEAVVGKKKEIFLYKGGKWVVTVDALSDNYNIFRKRWKKQGSCGRNPNETMSKMWKVYVQPYSADIRRCQAGV